MLTTVFETKLSLQDARFNTVRKRGLTTWAAIIVVPTAVPAASGKMSSTPIRQQMGFVLSTS